MAPKRKSDALVADNSATTSVVPTPRRSSRRLHGSVSSGDNPKQPPAAAKIATTAAASNIGAKGGAPKRNKTTANDDDELVAPVAKKSKTAVVIDEAKGNTPLPKGKKTNDSKKAASAPSVKKRGIESEAKQKQQPRTKTKPEPPPKVTEASAATTAATTANDASDERQYWLMKAEPETRLERGVDVKFSIDDLAARTAPEPWDGIRNHVARNNLRRMKIGDLAFFYHSNCKEPGIVGTMEIVQEHSPDLTAHDPKAPYYDASSKPSDPKWSVVHVEFRSKFAEPITLKELRDMGAGAGPLKDMQTLRQSRLSVSRVSTAEWKHLMEVAEGKGPVETKD